MAALPTHETLPADHKAAIRQMKQALRAQIGDVQAVFDRLTARIAALPGVGPWLGEQWVKYIGTPGAIGEVIQLVSGANIGNIYRVALAAGGKAFGLLLAMLFMLIALFFIYRDGQSFAGQVDRLGERILRCAGSASPASCRRRSAPPSRA